MRIPLTPPPTIKLLLKAGTNHTYAAAPTANSKGAADLAEAVLKQNPVYLADGTLNLPLIKNASAVLSKKAAKTHKAIDSTLIGHVATSIDAKSQKLITAIKARGSSSLWFSLVGGSQNPSTSSEPRVVLDAVVACDETPAAAAAAAAGADQGGVSAAVQQAQSAIISDANQNNNVQSVLSDLPAADAKTLVQSMIESVVLSYLTPLGNTQVPSGGGGTSPLLSPTDKANFAAASVTWLEDGDYNSGLSQITNFFSVADPTALPAMTSNFLSAWIAMAQGAYAESQGNTSQAQAAYQAAMAAIRAVSGNFTGADIANANTLVGGYLTTFNNALTAAAQEAASIAAVNDASSAVFSQLQASIDGSSSTFYPGGPCSLFNLNDANIAPYFTGFPIYGQACFLDAAGATCPATSGNLVPNPWNPTDGSGPLYCDYMAAVIGTTSCSAFAALDPFYVQPTLVNTYLGNTGGSTIAPLCVKDDPTQPCSTWSGAIGIADDGSDAKTCDYAPRGYNPVFSGLGDTCANFITDWRNLGIAWQWDPAGHLWSFVAGNLYTLTSDQQLVCTAFSAPSGGFPGSCEQIGNSFGLNIVTAGDGSGNCVYSVPPPPPTPDFVNGNDCSQMTNATNVGFIQGFVSELSLAFGANILCNNFAPVTGVAQTCADFGNTADPTTIQVKAVTMSDSSVSCQIDTGGFTAGTGTCVAFQNLSGILQAMFVQAANPGDTICATLAGTADGTTCSSLNPNLTDNGSGGCRLPPPPFQIGGACASYINGQPSDPGSQAVFASSYIAQLPYIDGTGSPNYTLCTNAAAAGISDCATIDGSLISPADANGNCSQPPPAVVPPFNTGDSCSSLLAQNPAFWSSIAANVAQPAPTTASVTVCTGLTAAIATPPGSGITQCSDIAPILVSDPNVTDSCAVAFPVYVPEMSCSDFAGLPTTVQENAVNTLGNNATLCTDVRNSPFETCQAITTTQDPTVTFTNSLNEGAGTLGAVNCFGPP